MGWGIHEVLGEHLGTAGERGTVRVPSRSPAGPQRVPEESGALLAPSRRAQEGPRPACAWGAKCSAITPPQDAKAKVEQLEGTLRSAETGQDLGSVRRLQTQHCQLERESQALAGHMAALVSQAQQVANSQPLAEETQKYLQRCSPARSAFSPLSVTLP